ncbi:asparagine synthase (glutamine-hydrolyzing) [Reyranella sp.]|uniref:asparagine synthase (glutamine-hydrolyzing) n=1 Tax=Reyranella sp. TaxID=1929291 RepID=UPI003BAC4ED1
MCGLAGGVLKKADSVPLAELRRRAASMAAILHHRGPDGHGTWVDPQVALAHTRLAIIDTTTAAAQPMHDETGTVHVVFNGEIYNFLELRAELVADGYRFANRSDTEVIVNGYRKWGTGLFAKLVGMFAIAIWDSRRKRLVLARDRFGEKPLYYADRPDALVFGSEIKALLTWPGMPRQPDMAALHDYLSFGFTLGPGTAFAGIGRLQPAHFLVWDIGNAPTVQRYWHMPVPEPGATMGTVEDLRHELIDRLRQAVKYCLVSDVPLGAFLSGGVDSSAVVATMAGLHGGGIKTFSSGFGLEDYDETRYATMVAERYRTDHSVFTFGSELLRSVGDLAWYYGEPFSDSSALVTYALSRETRRSVTVALTGDGADETLLGYARYFAYGDMRRSNPPQGARRLGKLYVAPPSGDADAMAATDAYGFMLERFREGHKLAGYGIAMLPHVGHCSYERLRPYFTEGVAPEEAAARFDQATYLPDDLLVKVDIAAMAQGLETRAPFLNHELAEWSARIPAHLKIWDREGKALLKKALEPLLPHECMYRPKVGFRVPVAKFMNEEIRDQTDGLLLSDRFLDRGIIREDFVREMLDAHRSGRQGHGTRLWALLSLEMWFRTWIDTDSNGRLDGTDDPFADLAGGEERSVDYRAPTASAPASPPALS